MSEARPGDGPGRHAPAQGRLPITNNRAAGDISHHDRIVAEIAIMADDHWIVMPDDDFVMIDRASNVHNASFAGESRGSTTGQKR